MTDKAQLTRLQGRLEPLLNQLTMRESLVAGHPHYLVLTHAQADLAAAEALVIQASEAGFKDTAVVYQGKYKNHVSFGYYSQERLAHERQATLAGKQLESAVYPQRAEAEVDLEFSPGVEGEGPLRKVIEEEQKDLELQQQNCPARLSAQ